MRIMDALAFTPLLMVMAFLLLTLVVGLFFSKKTTTLREYAVGNKKFATATLVATMLATRFGGEMIRDIEQVYNRGIYWIFLILSSSLPFLFLSRLVLRMGPFMQHFSMPETIGSVYDIYPRVITALSCIANSIASIAIQITVMSKVITMCIPLLSSQQVQYVTLFATLILIFYSSFGGIRSVAFTDVLQFITFTIIIPLLAWFIYQKIDKPVAQIIPFVYNQTKFQFSTLCHLDTKLIETIAMLLSFLVVYIEHSSMQRIYMASSVLQAKKVCLYVSFFNLIITGCIVLVSLFIFVAAPTLSLTEIWPYIMTNVPYFFKGLIAVSLLAMAMSTADSDLNACSVIVSHDIWSSMQRIWKIPFVISPLVLARLTTTIVGLAAMFLAFKYNDLLELVCLLFDFFVPIVTAPFLLAIYGFRGSSQTALIGMGTGATAIWAWNKWIEPTTGINGAFFCMLANGLAMMIAHYLLPNSADTGWVKPDDTYTAYKQNKAYTAKLRKESLSAIFANPKSYLTALKPSESKLIGTGFYIIINGFLSFIYYWDTGWHLGPILLLWIGVSLVSYILFFTAMPGWIVTLYLWLALLCALPIHSLCSWYYLPRSLLTLALSYTHIALLFSLLPRYIALLMAMPLFYLYTSCCYKIASLWTSTQLFLPLLGSGILLFGFMLYAKRLLDKMVAKCKLMELRNTYEQRISLETIYNQANLARLDAYVGSNLLTEMGKTLQETLQNLDTPSPIKKEIKLFLKKLDTLGHIWIDRSHAERRMALHPKAITSIDIASTIVKIYGYIETLDPSIQFFLRNQSSTTALEADSALLECLIMLNIGQLSKNKPNLNQGITLTLADTTLHYGQFPTGAKDATDTSSLALPAVAFAFSTDRTVKEIRAHYTVTHTAAYKVLPKAEAAFYQLESRQIVETHGGYTEIIEIADHLTCLYVLPVKGKQVMHLKTYDSADLVAAKVAETEESIAQEKELTALLIANTSLTQEQVTKTIAFIKKAHGLINRKSGAPYYTHPMEVAKLLLEVTQDPDTILAGLLHDVVEDTPITLNQIEMMYGAEVALLVDKVTEYHTNGYCWKLEKNQQKEILEACGDIRVVQVKLADRLHNMRTLYARKSADQQRIARETLTFYIPWGGRNKGPEAWLREMKQICERIVN